MRQDSGEFGAANKLPSKEPRLVVRIIFDLASIYVTSDEDMINVPGTPLLGHLQGVNAVSQEIHPDEGRSTIGRMSFSLVDIESAMTDALCDQLQVNLQNLRGRRVEIRLGYTNDYNDTQVLFTQQVVGAAYNDGTYDVICQDIQREERQDVLEPKITNLRLSIDEDDDVIPVQDTSAFEAVFHGSSYSDAPNQTVYYFRIDDEFIRATGKTADSFTGCTRGVFNTLPAAHEVEAGASEDRQPEVEEIIYLELPGPKLAYAILTGVLEGDAATLPAHWHMGIATTDVTLTQFQEIGLDLWDTSDDAATLPLRFLALDKRDGKQFLEEQVYRVLGLYSPVLNDGTLGLRRMNPILADAAHVMVLDEDVFTQVGALEFDYEALINVIRVDWNYDAIAERFTRTRVVIDDPSIDVHDPAPERTFEWEGIHGSRHTDNFVVSRIDSIRDRYAAPPLRLSGDLLHSANVLEVGDVVRVQLAHIRDYTGTGSSIDRSFEVQRIAVDQISGDVSVNLFGSSQAASVVAPDEDTSPLDDAWYSSAGTELSTVVTITAGVVQPGTYHLTGHASLNNAAAIYYFLGDLTLADGATLTWDDNVQLRIRGFFTPNGDMGGAGRGQAGLVDDGTGSSQKIGNRGWVGNTRPWHGVLRFTSGVIAPNPTWVSHGKHSSFPFLTLSSDGGTLSGLPDDIRGTAGAHGSRIDDQGTIRGLGGDGGASGAGLAIICRGMAAGPSGTIDVSGADGQPGEAGQITGIDCRAGSGGPGGPGSVLVLLDGSDLSVPSLLDNLTANWGDALTTGNVDIYPWEAPQPGVHRMGLNLTIENVSAPESVLRIQYVPAPQVAEEDVGVPAPKQLTVGFSPFGDVHVLNTLPSPAGVITEYYASITDDRGDAVLIGEATIGRYVHIPDPDTEMYYWARNREISTRRVSLFEPDATTSTAVGPALNRLRNVISNEVLNPEFEAGDVGWNDLSAFETVWPIVEDAANARRGSWVAQFTNAGGHSTLENQALLQVAPGQRVHAHASFRVDSADQSTDGMAVEIRWKTKDGGQNGQALGNRITPNADFELSEVTALAPAGTVYGQLCLVVHNDPQDGGGLNGYADGALMGLVPTNAQLGLGSIATRNVTISTSAPSGGSNGDLWFVREA